MLYLTWNENDNDNTRRYSLTVCIFLCIEFNILKSISPNSHINSVHKESNQWVKKMWQTENEFIDKLTLRAFAHKNFIAWTCCAVDVDRYMVIKQWQWHLTVHFISASRWTRQALLVIWVCLLTGYLSLCVCLRFSLFFFFFLVCVCVSFHLSTEKFSSCWLMLHSLIEEIWHFIWLKVPHLSIQLYIFRCCPYTQTQAEQTKYEWEKM